jgi:hypothetical protein
MERNVGGTERWIRWGAGGLFLAIAARSRGFKRWLGLAASLGLLGSAQTQKCAVNWFLGLNSYDADAEPRLSNE